MSRTASSRSRVLAAAAMVLLAAVCPLAANAHVGEGTYTFVNASVGVGRGEAVKASIICPSGKRLVSGGVYWHPKKTLVFTVSATCLPLGKLGTYSVKTRDLARQDSGGISRGDVCKYVSCPSGMRVVGGGAYWHALDGGIDKSLDVSLSASSPTTDGKGWYAGGRSALDRVGSYLPLLPDGEASGDRRAVVAQRTE